MIVISGLVFWIMYKIVELFNENKNIQNFSHSSVLEIVWTILPAIVLLFLAVPSFALLYSLDELIDPDITLKVIDITTKTLGITGGIIQGLEIALKLQLANPVPVPANVTKIIDILDKRLSSLKKINIGILSILVLLRQILTQVLQLLNLLDLLIQSCYPNDDQEQIAIDLTNLTIQQSTEVPVVTNINGFEMKVETENTNNSLKRRRAIAQNKQGVIMLKGEWSFSSIDQILIDELVFYIQQNNLKTE